jgi:hypothetical protein
VHVEPSIWCSCTCVLSECIHVSQLPRGGRRIARPRKTSDISIARDLCPLSPATRRIGDKTRIHITPIKNQPVEYVSSWHKPVSLPIHEPECKKACACSLCKQGARTIKDEPPTIFPRRFETAIQLPEPSTAAAKARWRFPTWLTRRSRSTHTADHCLGRQGRLRIDRAVRDCVRVSNAA